MLRFLDAMLAVVLTTVGVFGSALYANLSYDVTQPEGYANFPPFLVGVDANMNDHLGAEYFEIASALVNGRGYADPFRTESGPTAWMPPLLPLYTAGILILNDGDKIAGLAWGAHSFVAAMRERRLRPLLIACLAAAAVMSPWIVRNAFVFGRFIPVKSNLSYELYQSQLLNEEGRLSTKVFGTHPYSTAGSERTEYVELGEAAFLDDHEE